MRFIGSRSKIIELTADPPPRYFRENSPLATIYQSKSRLYGMILVVVVVGRGWQAWHPAFVD